MTALSPNRFMGPWGAVTTGRYLFCEILCFRPTCFRHTWFRRISLPKTNPKRFPA